MQSHRLRSTPVQSFSRPEGTLGDGGVRPQIGVSSQDVVERAFLFDSDLIARSRDPLDPRHGLFVPVGQRVSSQGGHVSKRLTRVPVLSAQ